MTHADATSLDDRLFLDDAVEKLASIVGLVGAYKLAPPKQDMQAMEDKFDSVQSLIDGMPTVFTDIKYELAFTKLGSNNSDAEFAKLCQEVNNDAEMAERGPSMIADHF